VPRRRFQNGRVYFRGSKWVGSYRDTEVSPETGERIRRTITFDASVTSARAARSALQPYLDRINVQLPNQPARGKKKLSELIEEWKREILPNRKLGGARASLSHIRTYITPLLGVKPLHELSVREHQVFVTAVGRRVDRRKTADNVYGTLTSILNKGRKWGYFIPEVKRQDIEFLADEKPKDEPFFFDANTAARVINAAPYPFKVMFLVAAICGLRIGEVTALKVGSLDFKRKLLHITAALDYATRKESTPKSHNSAASVHMPELLEKHLRDWADKRYKPNSDGYLFINSKGRPFPSDNVVKYGIHRAMDKLGIQTAKGAHIGIHCFRHGVTTELLESGTPIHVVTRMMRHGDSKVTLEHYAHVIGETERFASEKFSQRIGQNITQLESDPELESTPNTKSA
jgi:integrase